MSWKIATIATILFTVIIIAQYILKIKKEKIENSGNTNIKFPKKYICFVILIIIMDVIIYFMTNFGADFIQQIIIDVNITNDINIHIIDEQFNQDYTLNEFQNCSIVIDSMIRDNLSTEKSQEEISPNKKTYTPMSFSSASSYNKELDYWKEKCKNSKIPEYYRQYANVTYDFCIFLMSDDEKNYDKKIYNLAQISIENFLQFIKFDSITNSDISDALYRIAQTYDILAQIDYKDDSVFKEKMLVLSAIYYEESYLFKNKGSLYYSDISYYLADTYEKISYNCNNSNSLIWLNRASICYTNSVDEGFDKSKCYNRLYQLYLKIASDVRNQGLEGGSEYKSYNEYMVLAEKYKGLYEKESNNG